MGLFDMFKKRKVKLTEEQLQWNKLWDLWSEEKVESPYAELMTYQAEVNNGGHTQYFDNVANVSDLQHEMSIVEQMLSDELKNNLRKAYKAYLFFEKNREDENAEELLEQCDALFWEKEEEINCILQEVATKLEV